MAYQDFIWIAALIFFHELGHAVLAVKQDVYEGWSVFPVTRIITTHGFKRRIDYLSGLVGSMAALPVYLLFAVDFSLLEFFGLAVFGALADLLVVFLPKSYFKKIKAELKAEAGSRDKVETSAASGDRPRETKGEPETKAQETVEGDLH